MMSNQSATATACANIAFIKYWGNRDANLRIPVNGSISMNLAELVTTTTVTFSEHLTRDQLTLNGTLQTGAALERVSQFLGIVRRLSGVSRYAEVDSANNFPTGAGIASSAAAFAALSLAGSHAAGLNLSEPQLSALARRGSGSASRSIPAGYVEWLAGEADSSSYAISIAPCTHWDLVDCVAVVAEQEKKVGSSAGHTLADTSIFQSSRVTDAPRRLEICRTAILNRDFERFADIIEEDSTLMHAVMMTSHPALFYWMPASLAVMQQVREWRSQNLPAAYTLDAGPNVHVLCPSAYAEKVCAALAEIPGVKRVLRSACGGAAALRHEP
jgi:diphosphomevalonate decarboxylase